MGTKPIEFSYVLVLLMYGAIGMVEIFFESLCHLISTHCVTTFMTFN